MKKFDYLIKLMIELLKQTVKYVTLLEHIFKLIKYN